MITLAGEIDVATVVTVRESLADAARTTRGDVVLDLERVTFVDSTGIAALLVARQELLDEMRRLHLRRPSPRVTKVLAIMGLAAIFGLDPGAPPLA